MFHQRLGLRENCDGLLWYTQDDFGNLAIAKIAALEALGKEIALTHTERYEMWHSEYMRMKNFVI